MRSTSYYTKICIICSRSYECVKINTLYCGAKCRNRARYLPDGLKTNLIKRNTAYMMKANNYTAMVQNKGGDITAVGYIPEDASVNDPLGKDRGLLEALAREETRKRGIHVPSTVELVERKNKPFAAMAHDNLKYINISDPANGDSSGFGIKPETPVDDEMMNFKLETTEQIEQIEQQKQPKKTGLRRVGDK